MKKALFILFILFSLQEIAIASTRVVLVNGTGNELGTATNPVVIVSV